MNKLTPREAQDVMTMLNSSSWKVFEAFLQERRSSLIESLDSPDSIGSFFEREQKLGFVSHSKDMLSEFKYNIEDTAKSQPHQE